VYIGILIASEIFFGQDKKNQNALLHFDNCGAEAASFSVPINNFDTANYF
jgi:hypothetical protein